MAIDDSEALHQQHTDFSAGLLDVLRALIGHLVTGAPMTAETVRTRLVALLPERPSELGRLPIRRLIEDLDRIIAIRDGAQLDKPTSTTH